MNAVFTICDQKYIAPGLWEATQQVIDEARQLLKAGQSEQSRKLYEEAIRLRQGLQRDPDRHARSPRLLNISAIYRAIS